MDVYQNFEVFYILREKLLDEFVLKKFHIDRFNINKFRRKNQYLTVV